MEWNGIRNVVRNTTERLGITVPIKDNGWKEGRSKEEIMNRHCIWLGDEEGRLGDMSYKECLNRFRNSKTIRTGERRRKMLEAGDMEEEDARTVWREAKKSITDTHTRDFVFRLINGLLFANKDLHRTHVQEILYSG